jgi:hypothetical protein
MILKIFWERSSRSCSCMSWSGPFDQWSNMWAMSRSRSRSWSWYNSRTESWSWNNDDSWSKFGGEI